MIDDEKFAMVGAQGLQQDKENSHLCEGEGKSAPLKSKEVLAPSPHLLDEAAAALRRLASFPCPLCAGHDCSPWLDPQCPMRPARAALERLPQETSADTLQRLTEEKRYVERLLAETGNDRWGTARLMWQNRLAEIDREIAGLVKMEGK